jgi:predicted alternative tryptophan synthase beta-subunit
MLKGRDLQTERYYSKENIEELRKVYRDKIQPRLWTNVTTATPEELKALHDQVSGQALEIETLRQLVRNLAAKIKS